jgi:hypothetical protein
MQFRRKEGKRSVTSSMRFRLLLYLDHPLQTDIVHMLWIAQCVACVGIIISQLTGNREILDHKLKSRDDSLLKPKK